MSYPDLQTAVIAGYQDQFYCINLFVINSLTLVIVEKKTLRLIKKPIAGKRSIKKPKNIKKPKSLY